MLSTETGPLNGFVATTDSHCFTPEIRLRLSRQALAFGQFMLILRAVVMTNRTGIERGKIDDRAIDPFAAG